MNPYASKYELTELADAAFRLLVTGYGVASSHGTDSLSRNGAAAFEAAGRSVEIPGTGASLRVVWSGKVDVGPWFRALINVERIDVVGDRAAVEMAIAAHPKVRSAQADHLSWLRETNPQLLP